LPNPPHHSMTAIIISLVFSAFFSGIEIAFISSDKLRIEIDKGKGKLTSKILSRFTKNPSHFIGTTLIGNTLALVIYGIFMANLLEPLISQNLPEILNNQTIVFLLQTFIATLIVLLTAEFLPKSVFLINPNQMLNVLAIPIWLIYIILFPVVFVVVNLSKFIIIYVLRLHFKEDQPVFGLTDLNNFIQSKIIEDKTEKYGNV
jgi:putative hemolysin